MQSIILVCDEFVLLESSKGYKASGCLSAAFVDSCLRTVSTESAAGKRENLLVDHRARGIEEVKSLERESLVQGRETRRVPGSSLVFVLARWRNYRVPRLLRTPCP